MAIRQVMSSRYHRLSFSHWKRYEDYGGYKDVVYLTRGPNPQHYDWTKITEEEYYSISEFCSHPRYSWPKVWVPSKDYPSYARIHLMTHKGVLCKKQSYRRWTNLPSKVTCLTCQNLLT